MHILHVQFSFTTGGTETMLVDIINEQIKTNEVSLLVINDKCNKVLLDKIDSRVKNIVVVDLKVVKIHGIFEGKLVVT